MGNGVLKKKVVFSTHWEAPKGFSCPWRRPVSKGSFDFRRILFWFVGSSSTIFLFLPDQFLSEGFLRAIMVTNQR